MNNKEEKKTLTLKTNNLQPSRLGTVGTMKNVGKRIVQVEIKRNRTLSTNRQKVADNLYEHQDILTNEEKNSKLKVLKIAADQAIKDREEMLKRQEEQEVLAMEEAVLEAGQVTKEQSIELDGLAGKEEKLLKKESKKAKKTEAEILEEDELVEKEARKSVKADPKTSKWGEEKKFTKAELQLALEADVELEEVRKPFKKFNNKKNKLKGQQYQKEQEKIVREVILPENITIQELSNKMAEKSAAVVKELMKLGIIATVNKIIDADTAELIIDIFGHKTKRIREDDVEHIFQEKEEDLACLEPRAPVVTVMGHVDHGKTSLLDAIRASNVATKEAGGITQHIGAYRIKLPNGSFVTFLDTPGHEAFTAMRSRGAKVTDIVILVVAADDGIMAQTIEAINHAKAAEVPIIVAINKMDKPTADANRVKNELLSHNLIAEDMGGDVIVVEVSAKNHLNIDILLQNVLLQAEMLELKANPNRSAQGTVIEAKVDKNRGVIATLLVQKGTLNMGDIVVAGTAYGKIKLMYDDLNNVVKHAAPSTPVEVLGLNSVPEAGDLFAIAESEKQARDITDYRVSKQRDKKSASIKVSLEDLLAKTGNSNLKELMIIIKADVQGSAEAINSSIMKITSEEVKIKVLHAAVGGITESDISLAHASSAIILAFNVRANNQARELAAKENVDIRYYSIIYDLVNDVKLAVSGMLSPIIREKYLGSVEIRQVINITKVGKIAGSFVTKGIIKRGAKVRLLRDNIVIHEGKLKTLKRFKDDVKEVKEGFECGIAIENYDDIKEGDNIEVFETVEEQRTL